MDRQITEMHLELHEKEINVTTKEQHNIFTQKDIYREVVRPRDNHGVTTTSMRRQALGNGYKSPEAVPTLLNREAPLQRDSIGSITKVIQVETLNKDGKDETLVGEHKNLAETAGRPRMRSRKLWLMGMTDSRSPDMHRGMIDDTQDLSEMYEQT